MLDFDGSPLKVTSRPAPDGGGTIVAPVGDIDLTGSPSLRAELKRLGDARPARLVIDLAAVPYMDSSGIATLVEALQLARKSKTRLVLCGLQDKVRSIFEIAKLEMVFTIVPTVEDAMRA